MAINLPPLPNGLLQINTGVTPGDGQGDTLRTIANKINSNATITLTSGDNIAGTGLSWNSSTRKLSLSVSAGHILYGDTSQPVNTSEFYIGPNGFSVKEIDGSKVRGSVGSQYLQLGNGSIYVGNSSNKATEYQLGTEFSLVSGKLKITNLDFGSLAGVNISPGSLSLTNNNIVVGNTSNVGRTVTLGPDFIISNNILSLVASGQLVTLGSINATGASPGRVLSVKGPSNSMSLEWVDQTSGGGLTGSVELTDISANNAPSPLAKLQVSPDGTELEWNPSLERNIEASIRAYIQFLQNNQRRVNLDHARSIAELQNQTCEVYNYDVPSAYAINIVTTPRAVTIPGQMYIMGGASDKGYSKVIETLDFSTEVVKQVGSALPAAPISGASYTGLLKSKEIATSVASSSAMYVAGMGSANGLNDAAVETWTWTLEKFTFATQSSVTQSTDFGTSVRPRGGITFAGRTQGWFIGGLNSTTPSTVTNLESIIDYSFFTDTANVIATTIGSGNSTFRAAAESYWNNTSSNEVGYSFGGVVGATVVNTIRKFDLAGSITVSALATTLTAQQMNAASFDDGTKAVILGGAASFGVPDNKISTFTYATETYALNASQILPSLYSGMTGSASSVKGYVCGGTERVKQSVVMETYTDNLAVWAERIVPTTRYIGNVAFQDGWWRWNG